MKLMQTRIEFLDKYLEGNKNVFKGKFKASYDETMKVLIDNLLKEAFEHYKQDFLKSCSDSNLPEILQTAISKYGIDFRIQKYNLNFTCFDISCYSDYEILNYYLSLSSSADRCFLEIAMRNLFFKYLKHIEVTYEELFEYIKLKVEEHNAITSSSFQTSTANI
jgi:hypothetical protein